MCTCGSAYLAECIWGLPTCTLCGVTQTTPVFLKPSYGSHTPCREPYSRSKRFGRLLANVWGHRVSRCSPKLLCSLMNARPKTPQDIFNHIRASGHRKHKRYDAIAFLSNALIPGHYILPMSTQEVFWANSTFRNVESRHRIVQSVFPAYSWLHEKVLLNTRPVRTDLLQYVHRLCCPKRRANYEKLYGDLFKRPFLNSETRGESRDTQKKSVCHQRLVVPCAHTQKLGIAVGSQ